MRQEGENHQAKAGYEVRKDTGGRCWMIIKRQDHRKDKMLDIALNIQ